MKFVAASTATAEERVELRPLLWKIDQKEKHRGSLMRCGINWFNLIRGIEALYCANLTLSAALLYQGEVLRQIYYCIWESKWIQ
jgi:hypothetical protein